MSEAVEGRQQQSSSSAGPKSRMAGFKAPRYVEFRQPLPLNVTGKGMKDLLK
jgi:HIP---CoA ligase